MKRLKMVSSPVHGSVNRKMLGNNTQEDEGAGMGPSFFALTRPSVAGWHAGLACVVLGPERSAPVLGPAAGTRGRGAAARAPRDRIEGIWQRIEGS